MLPWLFQCLWLSQQSATNASTSMRTASRYNLTYNNTTEINQNDMLLLNILHPACYGHNSLPLNNDTYSFANKTASPSLQPDYQKVKATWILLKQETVSGSGISWIICKSAPHSRQITTPAPYHSVFYRPDALPAAQPTASKTEG